MYYRIFDEDNNDYISLLYNAEDKKVIKEEMKPLLLDMLSHDDCEEVTRLKWDQYVIRLKSLGYVVEQQPTPFPCDGLDSAKAWEEYLDDEDDEYDNDDWN